MYILENVPLSAYSTMRLGGPARYLTDINNREDVAEAFDWAMERNVPAIMIGSGSNIVWQDSGFPGLVMVNKLLRFESFREDDSNIYITAGAGENWDSIVERTVNLGLSGIEQLSLIPGTTGATPIQNVGAYGREIKDVLTTVEAYDSQIRQFVVLRGTECGFAYRTSRFKTTDKGRYFITAITLHLAKENPTPPFYQSVTDYFAAHTITAYTPATLRQAVIAIRTAKLPDPAVVANNGSFFYNPIVSDQNFAQLRDKFPEIVSWSMDDGRVKLSAAWLVEQAGFKEIHDSATGMATWPKQTLVLVNESATATQQLLTFRDKIIAAVAQKFGVTLQQEPELFP